MEILQNLLLKWICVLPCGCMTCDAMTCISVTELYKYFSYLIAKTSIFSHESVSSFSEGKENTK